MGIDLLTAMLGFSLCSAVLQAQTVSAERITRLIDDLDSARFAIREQAARDLFALEERAVEPLKKALSEKRSLEFDLRARRLLRKLAIYEPGGGEVVNGLRLRLTMDRDSLRQSQVLHLTTMIANLSPQPMRICMGPTPIFNEWENGGKLQRLEGEKAVEPRWHVALNVTGPVAFQTLAPKSFFEFKTRVVFLLRQRGDAFLGFGYTTFDVPQEGVAALRLCYQMPVNTSGAKGEPPVWTGTAHSNTVQIKLVR